MEGKGNGRDRRRVGCISAAAKRSLSDNLLRRIIAVATTVYIILSQRAWIVQFVHQQQGSSLMCNNAADLSDRLVELVSFYHFTQG